MIFEETKTCDTPKMLQYDGFEIKMWDEGLYKLTIDYNTIKKWNINQLEEGHIVISDNIIEWEKIKIWKDIYIKCKEKREEGIVEIAYKLCIRDYREPTMIVGNQNLGYDRNYYMKQLLAYKKEGNKIIKKWIIIDPKNNKIKKEREQQFTEEDKEITEKIFKENFIEKVKKYLSNLLKQ